MIKFSEYLIKNFNKNENLNLIEYSFKEVPGSLIEYYNDFSKNKKVFWKPETLPIITTEKEASQEEINVIKLESLNIKNENKHFLYNIETIPEWYYDFYKHFKSLSIYRGSIQLDKSLSQNTMCIKPKCLKGKFYIGRYSGITPQSCPIFIDEKGSVFVYDAKNFRNYPTTDDKKELKSYLNQAVDLIATWDNIEEFLVEECERLKKLFIINPSIYSIKNCSPDHSEKEV